MSLHIHLGSIYIELFVMGTFSELGALYLLPALKVMLHPYEKGLITLLSFLMITIGLSIRASTQEENFWGIKANEE